MLVFPTDSNEILLLIIWQGSFAFAATSVALAILLLIKHFFKERAHRNFLLHKKDVLQNLSILLEASPDLQINASSLIREEDIPIALGIAVDWLRNVSGNRAKQIVQLLRSINIQSHIEKAVNSRSLSIKIEALIYCGHETTPQTLDLLKKHCVDNDINVQLICLRGLAIRSEAAAIMEALSTKKLRKIHSIHMLCDIFVKLGNTGVSLLAQVMNNNDLPLEVRIASITACGHIGSLDAIPHLVGLYHRQDTEPDVKAQIVASLGRLGDYRGEPTILEALDDVNASVRINAARAAFQMPCLTFIPKLAALLHDPVWWVQFRAAQTLTKMGAAGQEILSAALGNQTITPSLRSIILENQRGDN